MIWHLVFDGVSDGSVGIGLEVIGAAARVVQAGRAGKRVGAPRQRVVSMTGEAVRTAVGRALAVDGLAARRVMRRGDVLVLPGLGMATPSAICGALVRPDIVAGAQLVARAAAAGVLVAASCSATFVLAASGVLDGQRATTTWWLGPTFRQQFPGVQLDTDHMVVGSAGAITAGAALAHADLMLAVVSRTLGPEVAHAVARYLLLDERASQARYMVLGHLTGADPVLRALEAFIVANLARQVSLDEMARATATSTRTLARKVALGLGTSPQKFVQRLRVARAVHLLETTRRSIDDIAVAVGYADSAAFRRVFREATGEAPRARRARAGA